MSEVKKAFDPKKHFYNTGRIETNVNQELSEIVKDFSNAEQLLRFIQSGSLEKTLKNWSILSNANSHTEFVDLSVKIAKVTFMINLASGLDSLEGVNIASEYEYRMMEVKDIVVGFYKNFIINHSKITYRCLNSFKPSTTNPLLKTLINAIKYDQSLASELYNNFDLTMANLPKLLVPTKMDLSESAKRTTEREEVSIRANFLRFLLTWFSRLSSLVRKDVLFKNYKIMGGIWKYMFEVDSIELLSETFTFVKESILFEKNFKKSTKCLILNEYFFKGVQPIFLRVLNLTTHPFVELFNSVMTTIISDVKNGLRYPTPKLWQNSREGQETALHHEISLNNQSYRINNKSLYALVTAMRPFESYNQLEFVEKLLFNCPEIIPVYMQWTIQDGGGYHEPSLTSWWVSHTLLYSRIISAPIPAEIDGLLEVVSQNVDLDIKAISESVYLAPLMKGTLSKCLETNKSIITQLSLQLILQICLKLKALIGSHAIGHKQELIDLFFNNLPDLLSIIAVFKKNDEPNGKQSRLIKLTCLEIMNLYVELYPNLSANSMNEMTRISDYELSKLVDSDLGSCSKYNLSLLNELLMIQSSLNHDQLKWWNKSKHGHSLFTSLVKLGSVSSRIENIVALDETFVWKTANLLVRLTDNKLIFNNDLLVSPIFGLIYSFDSCTKDLPQVWNLLDEVISRVIRGPYKYIDLSHGKYQDVGIFVVALIEQFSIVFGEESDLSEPLTWLFNCLKYFVVIGESRDMILKLLDDILGGNEAFTSTIKSNNLYKIIEFDTPTTVDDSRNNPFFTMAVNTCNLDFVRNIKTFEKKPMITKLDLTSLIFKIELILDSNEFSSSKKFDEVIVTLFSKLCGYVLSTSDEVTFNFLVSSKFWSRFLKKRENLSAKQTHLIFSIINQLFEQLPNTLTRADNELTKHVYSEFQKPLDTDDQYLIGEYSWVLTDSQITKLLGICDSHTNTYLTLKLMSTCLKNKIPVDSRVVFGVLVDLQVEENLESQKRRLLSTIIEEDLIHHAENTDVKEILRIDSILNDDIKQYLLDVLFRSVYRDDLLQFLREHISRIMESEKLMLAIAFTLSTNLEDVPEKEDFKALVGKATETCLQKLFNSEVDKSLNQYLVILTNGLEYVDDLSLLTKKIFESTVSTTMAPEITNFICALVKAGFELTQDVKTWIHKATLYITKHFAEKSTLSPTFDRFLISFENLIKQLHDHKRTVWAISPESILNTQLEVILNHKEWVQKTQYLKYALSLVFTSSEKSIAYEKLLQIFINNKSNTLNILPNKDNSYDRFMSALLMVSLFNVNPSRNASELLQDKLVLFYLGTNRAEDLLIKTALIKIEAQITKSWIIKVNSWAFTDEISNNEIDLIGEDKLVIGDKSGFAVVLNKNFVKNTIENYHSSNVVVPEQFSSLSGSVGAFFQGAESFYERICIDVEKEYRYSCYDVEFLMMVVLNNEELLRFVTIDSVDGEKNVTRPIFNTKNLIDSYILQLLVISLSHENKSISGIAQVLLQGVLKSLGEEAGGFQDTNIFRVYVANILNTLRQETEIPGLVWYVYASFIPILVNPEHILYEKCFRFVLGNTSLYAKEIPLYSSIIFSVTKDSESDHDEAYYRQITWLIDTIILGVKTECDIHLLQIRGVFEWILNLLNSPFTSMRLKSQIYTFLYKIEAIGSGSDLLVSRFGIMCNMEQNLSVLKTSLQSAEERAILEEQLKLNLQQVVLRLGIYASESQRLKHWMGGDLPQLVKRLRP